MVKSDASAPYMKILFAHQYFGAFGGAETNIHITATELHKRGHTVALLHASETGRGQESWERIFPNRFQVRSNDGSRTVNSVVESFNPDIIYLHVFPNLGVIES